MGEIQLTSCDLGATVNCLVGRAVELNASIWVLKFFFSKGEAPVGDNTMEQILIAKWFDVR